MTQKTSGMIDTDIQGETCGMKKSGMMKRILAGALSKALKNVPEDADTSYSIDDTKYPGAATIDEKTGVLTAADIKASKGITVTATVNGVPYTTKVKIK